MVDKTRLISIQEQKPPHPRRCETCDYFDAPIPPAEEGRCVAQFPVPIPMGANSLGQLAVASIFPPMKPENRCAKWEVKRPTDN